MMFRGLLVSLLIGGLVAFAPDDAEACSCLPPTLAQSYNSHSDVFIGVPRAELVIGQYRVYLVSVGRVYKGCYRPRQRVFVVTAVHGATCGVKLQRGQAYLLTAQSSFEREPPPYVGINLCGYNRRVTELTADERAWLASRYVCCGDSCHCADGSPPVMCFADPCATTSCAEGTCTSNYCGGCRAEFYDDQGYAVCTACETDEDCAWNQHCGMNGECRSNCWSDEDCEDGQWCRPTQSASRSPGETAGECAPYQQEGEACGGFTPIWAQLKCAPGLVCTDVPPFIADIPGKCRVPCKADEDCGEGQYCGASGVCRDHGACFEAADCEMAGNLWAHEKCIGYGWCDSSKTCDWTCGAADCGDLAGVDFGDCEAALGYGVIDGMCSMISGCDAMGHQLLPSFEACYDICGGAGFPW